MDIPKKLQEEIWQYCMANNNLDYKCYNYIYTVNIYFIKSKKIGRKSGWK